MEYLSITFPEELKKALDQEAKREHTKRSTLIQKAVKVYLELKRRKHMTEPNQGVKQRISCSPGRCLAVAVRHNPRHSTNVLGRICGFGKFRGFQSGPKRVWQGEASSTYSAH